MTRRALHRWSRHVTIGCVIGIVGLVGCRRESTESPKGAAKAQRPTVIFILVDALRADRLGCYGCSHGNSPTIDALATEGVLFERAVAAAPWTQPSIASLFSGVYPTAHGVLGYKEAYESVVDKTPAVTVFSDDFETLAESMKRGGYTTAAFVANPFVVREFGFAQGFDHFDASFASNLTNGDVVNKAVLDWLDTRTDKKPLFLYLHYMDVHGPYDAAPKFLDPLLDEIEQKGVSELLTPEAVKKLDYLWQPPTGPTDLARHNKLSHYREYWEARYEAGIRRFDYYFAQLESELKSRGIWNDAMIVLTADHGEALYEHGYWDHGFSVYDTDLHVPLILRRPGVLPAGKRIPDIVRLIDVQNTLCDQFGITPPANTQGRALSPLFTKGGKWDPVSAYAEGVKIGPEQRAMYAAGWKLLLHTDTDKMELYHFVRDPGEQTDLATKYPRLVEQMRTMLDDQLTRNQRRAAGLELEKAPLTDEKIKQIRSLGYTGD